MDTTGPQNLIYIVPYLGFRGSVPCPWSCILSLFWRLIAASRLHVATRATNIVKPQAIGVAGVSITAKRSFAMPNQYTGRTPIADRLWSRVKKTDTCWLFMGSRNAKGYGQIATERKHRPILTHRLAWQLANGPIPDGLEVCHHCDTPSCCRVDHLFLGTHKENMEDCLKKGRVARGERGGQSKLSTDDVLTIRSLAAQGAPQDQIALRFGVSRSLVSLIVQRKRWAHIDQ